MAREKMLQALNEQIQKEFSSSYIYMAMEAWFAEKNLDGFSNYFRIQAMEEKDHAYKIFDYVNKLGGKVTLEAIPKPKSDYSTVEEVVAAALAHEEFITASINSLMDMAVNEKDHATVSFLNWFIDEQMEEEENAQKVLNYVKMLGGDSRGLFMIDMELGKRKYTPPAASEE